jgi:hypothetical protein
MWEEIYMMKQAAKKTRLMGERVVDCLAIETTNDGKVSDIFLF